MPSLRVSRGPGNWPTPRNLYYRQGSTGWTQVKAVFVLQQVTQLTLDPPTYRYQWVQLGDYAAPTETPYTPGLIREGAQASTLNTEAAFRSYETVPDRRSTYSRELEYYRNGLSAVRAGVGKSLTRDVRTWSDYDAIRVRIRFINSAGAGPWSAFSEEGVVFQ